MGFLQWLGFRDAVTSQTGPLTPFATADHLEAATWAHLLELEASQLPITRQHAMSIPAIARGRHVLTGQIGRLALQGRTGNGPARDQRVQLVLDQPETGRPRALTIAWTVDACLFYGRAWWHVTSRYSRSEGGRPRRFEWIPEHEIGDDGGPTVRGHRVDAADLIRIDGPHEGILRFAQPQLKAARALYKAAARAADNPVPSIDLHQTTPEKLNGTEIQQLIKAWAAARRGDNGGVAYTNSAIDARTLGQPAEQLLIAARKAVAVEMAQILNLPAWAVDAEMGGSSITYSNSPSRMRELLDISCTPYLDAIAGRLSMDDIAPAGTWVRFLTETLTTPDFAERMAGYTAAQAAGIYTVEQCQALEAGTPLEGATTE